MNPNTNLDAGTTSRPSLLLALDLGSKLMLRFAGAALLFQIGSGLPEITKHLLNPDGEVCSATTGHEAKGQPRQESQVGVSQAMSDADKPSDARRGGNRGESVLLLRQNAEHNASHNQTEAHQRCIHCDLQNLDSGESNGVDGAA
jgi:hypothetical protein